jgi:hypothetical protein
MRLTDEHWRAKWREAVERAGRSGVCRGENPKFLAHGLRMDTFLKDPDMLVRILEGEFDDGPAGKKGAPPLSPSERQARIAAQQKKAAEERAAAEAERERLARQRAANNGALPLFASLADQFKPTE